MATLGDVIKFYATRTNMKLPDARADIVYEINNIWRQMWNSVDGPESRQTIFMQIPQPLNQREIVFPYYVQNIRAVRAHQGDYPIKLLAPEAFMGDVKSFQNYAEWVVLPHCAQVNSIQNASPLEFRLADKEPADVVISLTGVTTRSQNANETLVIKAGQTRGVTKNAFSLVASCIKTTITNYDVAAYDGDGVQIIELPNCYLEAFNLRVKVKDWRDLTTYPSTCFNILFETRCPYLYNDADLIPEPFQYALQNKAVAAFYAPKVTAEGAIDPRTEVFSEEGKTALAANTENNVLGQVRYVATTRSDFSARYNGYF